MATLRDRPYARSNYLVDLGAGIDPAAVQGGFDEVILPDGIIEAVEYRNGNEKTLESRKLPGCVKYENLILKRGVIGALDLYQWWNNVRNGTAEPRNVSVQLLSEDRSNIVLTWRFSHAWPVRYGFEPLGTDPCGPAVEVIELAFERMELE